MGLSEAQARLAEAPCSSSTRPAEQALLGSARPGHWDGKEDIRLQAMEKARGVALEVRQRLKEEAYTDILPAIKNMRESSACGDRIGPHAGKSSSSHRATVGIVSP